MAAVHSLDKHCRVCGGRLQRAKGKNTQTARACVEHQLALLHTFKVDVTFDDAEIHPSHFCNGCYAATRRQAAAASKGNLYHHSIAVFPWSRHLEQGCEVFILYKGYTWTLMTGTLYLSKVCQHLAAVSTGGGQNKKARRSRGPRSQRQRHPGPANNSALASCRATRSSTSCPPSPTRGWSCHSIHQRTGKQATVCFKYNST